MPSLEQVLNSIRNSSIANVAAAMKQGKTADPEKQLKMEILRQRIAENRSPIEGETEEDIDIFTPGGLQKAKLIAGIRGAEQVEPDISNKERLVEIIETLKNPFASREDKEYSQATINALKDKLSGTDTSYLDRFISGKSRDWQDLMKARPYARKYQFEEGRLPWSIGQRASSTTIENVRDVPINIPKISELKDPTSKVVSVYTKNKLDPLVEERADLDAQLNEAAVSIRQLNTKEARNNGYQFYADKIRLSSGDKDTKEYALYTLNKLLGGSENASQEERFKKHWSR